MTCAKLTFSTRKDAKSFIRTNDMHGPTPYKCPDCGYFHTTTESSEKRAVSRIANLYKRG